MFFPIDRAGLIGVRLFWNPQSPILKSSALETMTVDRHAWLEAHGRNMGAEKSKPVLRSLVMES